MVIAKLLRLVFLCAAFWGSQAYGLVVGNQKQPINLATDAQVLADPTSRLTYEQIQSASYAHRFAPAEPSGQDLNFGFTQKTYWIKLMLSRAADAQENWILSIPYQTLDKLVFYAPGEAPIVTGNLQPFDSRPIKDRFFVYPIKLGTEPQAFYLQVHSQYSLTVPMEIWSPQVFHEQSQNRSTLQGVYFGELLALLVYNFLLFLYLRDKTFLFYTLFGVSIGMAMFAGNGFGRVYLWQDMPHWDEVAQCTCLSLASLFGILFTKSFLGTAANSPMLNKVLVGLAVCFSLISLMLPIAHEIGFPAEFLFIGFAIIAPTTTLIMFAAGVMAFRAGRWEARFFLLAWGVLWTGGFIAAMRSFGLVPSTLVTNYAVQISSAIEMLLLSFALADRIRIERQANERTQLEKLAMEQQLVRTLKDAEQRLENTVAMRTTELEQSLANERNLRQMLTRFGAFISHEFRNPLNQIESQIALFQREIIRKIDNSEQRLSAISGATRHLAELFDRWLKAARLNYELNRAESETIVLDKWLQPFIRAIEPLYPEHILICVAPRPIRLIVDTKLLKTALANLVDNACKYSAKGSRVQVRVLEKPGVIGIQVIDQGRGISQADQARIFEEYVRVEAGKHVFGLGLGLAFVQQIMRLHGGYIDLGSEPGRGSVFTMWFPENPKTRDATPTKSEQIRH